jgi:Putative transposase
MARLAALVPKPRVNLTRFHGVFAPNSKLRAQVTLSGRGKRPPPAPQTVAGRLH